MCSQPKPEAMMEPAKTGIDQKRQMSPETDAEIEQESHLQQA